MSSYFRCGCEVELFPCVVLYDDETFLAVMP